MPNVVAFFKTRAVRWTLLSLAGVVAVAVVALYAGSQWTLSRTYQPPAIALRTQGVGSPERGAHLATVIGCTSCHGTRGRVLFEVPLVARLVAPDLARVAKTYSDAELAVLLRAGIKRDQTSTIEMPSSSFSSLADADLVDIIAWLRSLQPEAQTVTAQTTVGPIGRVMLLTGTVHMSAQSPHEPAPPAVAPSQTPVARGEYLVKLACSHCHRLNEPNGVKPGVTAPPLLEMAQAYDLVQFTHLLRDGKGVGERELGLMSEVVRDSFTHFDDAEIAAIHAYLASTPAN